MKPQTPVQRARLKVMSAMQQWSDLRVRYYREPGVPTQASLTALDAAVALINAKLKSFERAIRAEERKTR